MNELSVTEQPKKRKVYFDILRIIATFAVVMIHISAQNWDTTNINSFEWNIFNFYDSIVRWGVPIFVMISGALFLNGSIDIKKIYKKNIFRIIVAFCFWSFIYTVYLYFKYQQGLKSSIISFFTGYYHMWFLFMIVGLYIITPLLNKICESNFLTKYFIVVAIIFAIVVPFSISIISIRAVNLGYAMQTMNNYLNLHFILGYTLYYILGYYLSKTDLSKKKSRLIYIFGLCGFILTFLLTKILSEYTGTATTLFYDNFTPNVFLETIFIFVVFKNIFSKIKSSNKIKSILYKLSKYSFGVYLVHPLVIIGVNELLNLNTLSFNPVLSVPIIGIMVFGISCIISAIINHIPVLNKYIV